MRKKLLEQEKKEEKKKVEKKEKEKDVPLKKREITRGKPPRKRKRKGELSIRELMSLAERWNIQGRSKLTTKNKLKNALIKKLEE